MGTFSGGLQETSLERQYGASLGAIYRNIWGLPQDVTLRRPQDVIFGRPEDVGRVHPLALHIGPYRGVIWTLHRDFLKTSYLDVLRRSVGNVPCVTQSTTWGRP